MKIARFRQPAISALAVLLISGAGVAFAANNGSTSAPVQAAPIQQVTPAAEVPDPAVEPVEPTGADTDTLQEGDQTTPDAPATSAKEATTAGSEKAAAAAEKAAAETESAGAETENAGAEEPGDANLPGGGHADDPNDPNADHQFEGVE